ncbi:hypothetical protein CRUP_020505, partial [Coryphaenoides rupestris]
MPKDQPGGQERKDEERKDRPDEEEETGRGGGRGAVVGMNTPSPRRGNTPQPARPGLSLWR